MSFIAQFGSGLGVIYADLCKYQTGPFCTKVKVRAIRETNGYAKIIFLKGTLRNLSAHNICPESTETIVKLAFAITIESTLKEITYKIDGPSDLIRSNIGNGIGLTG